MNKKILNILQYLLFLGVGIFLLWFSVKDSDLEEIKRDITSANFVYLIPATLMLLVSHFIRAIRWKILMEPLGYKPSLVNTFLAVLIGYWANLAFPRLGEVLKCTILAKYEKVPADKLVGTIVAERAFDVVNLALMLAITIAIQYQLLGGYASERLSEIFHNESGEVAYLPIFTVIVCIALGFLLIGYLLNRLAHISFVHKVRQLLKGIWAGLTSVRYIKNKGWFFFHTIMIWVLYLVSTYMGFLAMEGMSGYGLKAAFSALSFGSIGMIIPAPGGIGSFQYAVQQVLLVYDISPEKGWSLGMLIWIAQTGIIIIFGTISFLLLPVINKPKNEKPRLHPEQNI
jgi:uncharacterized protein (TIRG00374 family)